MALPTSKTIMIQHYTHSAEPISFTLDISLQETQTRISPKRHTYFTRPATRKQMPWPKVIETII